MIDAFIKIVDRLIEIREYKGKRTRQIFTELIEPIFNDLERIHVNYEQIFKETSKLLPSREEALGLFNEHAKEDPFINSLRTDNDTFMLKSKEELNRAIDYLRDKRREFEPLRDKLRILVSSLKESSLGQEEDDFIRSVIEYFPGGIRQELAEKRNSLQSELFINGSVSWGIVKYMEERLQEADSYDVIERLHMLLDNGYYFNRSSWKIVCDKYAKAKTKAAISE